MAPALRRGDLPDNFTRGLYKLAPYRGCAHGCRYCDGRAERYFVEGDFETDIESRIGIPEALAREFPALREEGMVVFGSGTTDPYQPLEASDDISGQAARLLASPPPGSLRLPVTVMTKSSLVERDLSAWKAVNEARGFVLLMSITSVDEELRRRMEPGAPSFAERLHCLAAFKAAGCATGILAMPLLPGLSDSEASISRLYEAAVAAGVDFVMPGGLTLRPGRQKELYLRTLEKARPDLLDATLELYREERESGAPLPACRRELAERTSAIGRSFSMPFLLPHRIVARMLPAHDSFHVLLRDMLELWRDQGVDTRPLQQSAKSYSDWLVSLRRHFRRHRNLPGSWLDERFQSALETDELAGVLANPKLAGFARRVLVEGARLDYLSLKLVS